jgi:RNA ligase
MNYMFPNIHDIDDVLWAIKDAPEFIVAEKDGYTVINYVVAGHDTFPSMIEDDSDAWESIGWFNLGYAIRRECRGLIFGSDGRLINRRYHKFFNVNEKDETQLDKIDWSKPHVILEKLDGSMVTPCYVNGHVRWMTKMGITDTSMEAEAFVASRPDYVKLAVDYLKNGFTPVFEWCSNKNRIVLDYPEDRLVLTAIRHNGTGNYMLHDALERIGERYGVDVVKAWSMNVSHDMLIDLVRQSEDCEGVVVRFDDGHMIKIKADWYVRIHKIKSLLGQERDVVELILKNELDDMLPVLPREDVERVEKFQSVLMEKIVSHAKYADSLMHRLRDRMDRKTFALEVAPTMPAMWRALVFQFWDKECDEHLTYLAIRDTILKNCGSNASYAKVKEAFLKEANYV